MAEISNPLAAACASRPFSNGSEGDAWMSQWCRFCVRDHGSHDGSYNDCCPIINEALLGCDRWPEAWLPEPDDGSFSRPSRLVCGAFQPCTKDSCSGDPGAEDRAERVAEVTVYWRDRLVGRRP